MASNDHLSPSRAFRPSVPAQPANSNVEVDCFIYPQGLQEFSEVQGTILIFVTEAENLFCFTPFQRDPSILETLHKFLQIQSFAAVIIHDAEKSAKNVM